jgi:NAD-dependent dihydropyrimidine dehydrogenase PreA subunit
MKKLAIVYFSGTGNTKYIAEKMKEAIIKTNVEVDLINIEKDKIDSQLYDYIIIGGPVYVERYPEILLKYIEKNLSNYKGTCMMYSSQANDGATPVFKHAIKRIKHINVTYYNYIAMPNNFYTFMFKKCPKDKETELLKAASVQVEKMVLEFLDGKTNSYEIPNSRVIMAEVAYRFVYPFFRKVLMRKLEIDKDKCIKCGKCEKLCPAKSIRIDPKLKINNDCTFCQRCINTCPKNAFLYKGETVDQYKPVSDEKK